MPVHADTAQGDILTYNDAFFADARPNTALDMIQRLPGFSFDDGNSARGFAGTAGNVLIDGQRPTSKTDDLQSILQRIPASNVDHIDVIRGGAPGIDMHDQTVVANVVLKKTDSSQYILDVEDNVFKDGHTVPNLSLQYSHHNGDSSFEGSITRYGNFDDSVGWGTHTFTDLTTGDVIRQRARTTGMGSGGALTAAARFPMWGGSFKANLALQDNPFYSTATYYGAPGNRYITDDGVNRNLEVGLHWNGHFGTLESESLILERLGFGKDVNVSDQPGDDELFRISQTTDETILRETLRFSPLPGLTVETGGEGAYNSLKGDSAYIYNGANVVLPSATPFVQEKRGELFVQGTWKISSDWIAEAGARFEFSKISEHSDNILSRSFFYPKPRAVLTWTPDKDWQVRLRYEKVVGQLDFNNFVASGNLGGNGVQAGNSDLRPDQHTQYAVSLERDFWGKGAIVLSLMHEDITDVVDLVPVKSSTGDYFDAPGNIGNGINNHIDLEVTLPLDKMGLTNGLLSASNVFNLTSVRDPVTGVNRVVSGQRPQSIQVSLTQDIASLKSTWSVYFYNCWDDHYYRLAQTEHRRVIPPYLGAYWEYKPTPKWSFHFELINLDPFVFQNTYYNYAGPRDSSPLTSIDDRTIKSQPRFFVQIRRTFDG